MKQIFTFSLLLIACITQAQTTTTTEQQAVVVGGQLTANVKDGLFKAYLAAGKNQVALVAGQAFTSIYYAVYAANGRVITGKLEKRYEGEYDLIDLGFPADNPKVVFSDKPLIAHSLPCLP